MGPPPLGKAWEHSPPVVSSTHILNKRAISFIPSDVLGYVCERCSASSQSASAHCFTTQEVADPGHSASHSCYPCYLSAGSGKSVKSFSSACTSGCHASQVGPSSSTLLPHCGYVSNCPSGAACSEFGGLANTPQPVLLAHSHDLTRLCNSICLLPSQFQEHPLYVGDRQGCPCAEIPILLMKYATEPVPPAEMKLGFYSPYFIVPKNSGGL